MVACSSLSETNRRALHAVNGRVAVILARRLVAAVGDAALRHGTADDGAEDEERLLERQREARVVGVHQHVRSGLDFRHARDAAADVVRPGSASRHDVARQPVLLEESCGRDERVHRLARARLALAAIDNRLQMSFVPITPRSRRPPVAATRRASASASSPGATPHRFCPTFTSTRMPTVTPARAAAAAICSSPSTESAAIVIDRPRASAATRSHFAGPMTSLAMRMSSVSVSGDLRLGHRGARQAGDRPGGQLAARDLRRLVRLEMGTKPARSVGEEPRHPLNVAVHRRDIDDERRRRNLGDDARTGHGRVNAGGFSREISASSRTLIEPGTTSRAR